MSRSARLGAIAGFWLAVGLIQTFNWGGGVPKAVVMLLVLAAAPFAIAAAQRPANEASPGFDRAVSIALWLCLGLEMLYLGARIAAPHVIDIATTTLAAGHALLHGQNPYAMRIDAGPESGGFTGYKYLPVMIAAFLPLGATLGERGVLLTNLVLLLGSLVLMKRLARSNLAPLLLVMLPLVAEQLFAKGATDLAAVLPLLAGFLFFDRSSFAAGLCVGLSLATKLLPGAAAIPALLPAKDRGRYLAGIGVGLLPALPFLVAAPRSFLGNIVLFNLARGADATSWLYSAPPAAAAAAHLALAAAWLAALALVWRRPGGLTTRCGVAAMLILAAILAGPGAHHNYQLWWLPLYCVVLSRALAPAGDEACQAGRLRYTRRAEANVKGI